MAPSLAELIFSLLHLLVPVDGVVGGADFWWSAAANIAAIWATVKTSRASSRSRAERNLIRPAFPFAVPTERSQLHVVASAFRSSSFREVAD